MRKASCHFTAQTAYTPDEEFDTEQHEVAEEPEWFLSVYWTEVASAVSLSPLLSYKCFTTHLFGEDGNVGI